MRALARTQIDASGLEKALLSRTIETVGERITKALDAKAAAEVGPPPCSTALSSSA